MAKVIHAADLFCGAGGTSTGLYRACHSLGRRVDLVAINHWPIAIETHSANHPDARHICARLDAVRPEEVVKSRRLNILVASPECTHHSIARGGKPVNDQRRSSAGYVLKWLRQLDVQDLILENVPEFEGWGPLYPDTPKNRRLQRVDKQIPERKGELFQKFVHSLRRLGYRVEWRVLCAADYGDATTRERLFIRARHREFHGGRIDWPAPTHRKGGSPGWHAAREIIDWSVPGKSIYLRNPPLCPKTMQRILAGLRKFSGLEPFLVEYHGNRPGTDDGANRHRSVDEPLGTQDTSNRFGLVQPYLVNVAHGVKGKDERTYPLDDPLGTITGKGTIGLASPYLVVLRNHADAQPLQQPLPTICAEGQHLGVAQPYLVNMKGKSDAVPIDNPLPTQTAHAQHLALATPFLVPNFSERDGHAPRGHSVDAPLPAVTSHGAGALIQPVLLDPFLTKYYGTGGVQSVDTPLDTVTAKDRFGLTQPIIARVHGETYLVDILYRMLLPKELAAAMSFPTDYIFTGNQGEQVRQIGNAVPVRLSTALCRSMLEVH